MSTQEPEHEFSFKDLLVPFTTLKAVHWIIFIGIAVFLNGIFNNFVRDDGQQVVNNPIIQSIANIPFFFTGSTFYNGAQQNLNGAYYKPVLNIVFALIYTFFGPNYAPFHIFQILLHIINACLIFMFFKKIFKKTLSFALSLIFLVHPINSEAVFYISAIQEPLFFFFGIFGLLLLQYFQSKKTVVIAVFCLFLSLLAKETGILFVIIAIFYVILFKKKFNYLLLGGLISTLIVYLLLRIYAVGLFTHPTSSPIDKLNLIGRISNIPWMFFLYIKTFFFPINLASSYQWIVEQISFTNFFLPLVGGLLFIFVVFSGAIYILKKHKDYFKIYIFFFSWFLLGVFLHMQIFPLDITLAERWFYFPIVGLLGMIGVLVTVCKINVNNKFMFISLTILLVLLSTRTYARSFDWRSEDVLDMADIKNSPNDYVLENGIGWSFFTKGKIKEAQAHVMRSIKLYPYYTNYDSLGMIYLHLGDYQKAKEAFLNSLKYGDFYFTYEELGGLTVVIGDQQENIQFLKKALSNLPLDSKLWLYLAIAEYKSGQRDAAKYAANRAYELDPNPNGDASYVYNKILNNKPLHIAPANP